jgi:hypothetical protein
MRAVQLEFHHNSRLNITATAINVSISGTNGAWGSVVVKALRYYSDRPEIDSR